MPLILAAKRTGIVRACAVMYVLLSTPTPTVHSAQPGPTAITRISSTVVGVETVVTIEADGPLPPPVAGTVDGPPRIFLDFPGVLTKAPARTSGTGPLVRRVRVALHQSSPPVTRVVVDLVAFQAHRIEQIPGKVIVFVGDAVPVVAPAEKPTPVRAATALLPPIPAVPDLPRPSAVAAVPVTAAPRVPAAYPTPPSVPAAHPPPLASAPPDPAIRPTYRALKPAPSARDLTKYKGQAGSAIDRLRLQLPLFESLSASEAQPEDRLQLAINELDRIERELSDLEPPETVQNQHDLLRQAARLGLMAVRLRVEAAASNDAGILRNAASAAAGAILTLDRACADIGCTPPPGR